MNEQEALFLESIADVNAHLQAHEERLHSEVERRYGKAMRKSTNALRELASKGSFDTILQIENILQQQDLDRYSKNETVRNNVLDGIDDFKNGRIDYKNLLDAPDKYTSKAYVKRDMAGPDKSVPLDSMRKALRSQAARVRNYARNPMANDDERDFHNARVNLLRKAEKLYDRIQHERLHGN